MDAVLTGLAAAGGSLLGGIASAIAVLGWLKRHPRPVNQEQVAVVADAVAERMAAMRDQAWFWTPEWQEGERDADSDIEAGRVTTFKNSEDFTAHLDAIASRRLASSA